MITLYKKGSILFILTVLFTFLCSCSKEGLIEESDDINPQHIFTEDGYFIDKNNNLFYYNGEDIGNVILSDIVKVYSFDKENHFAIDNHGAVWAWGMNQNGALGIGHSEYQEKPQKIKELDNVMSIQSCYQYYGDDVMTFGLYTLFLIKNGDVKVSGTYFNFDDKYLDQYANEYDINVFPVNFKSMIPISIDYKVTAKELLDISGQHTKPAMLMQNNDLVSIQFDGTIKTNVLLQDCKEIYTMNDFCVATTNDGLHMGWGGVYYLDESTGEHVSYNLENPSILSGFDRMKTCSEEYISMDDGSFWSRKNNHTFLSGELISDIEEVVSIQGSYAMTSNGELYYIDVDSKVYKVFDTGYSFMFEKSNIKYNLNIEDDYWKFGGYSQ